MGGENVSLEGLTARSSSWRPIREMSLMDEQKMISRKHRKQKFSGEHREQIIRRRCICPDIFRRSPQTICLKPPRVVAEQRSADGETRPTTPLTFSRSTNPLLRKRGGLCPRHYLHIYISVAKSGFDLLKINVLIFVRFLLSNGKMCLFFLSFFNFSPPTRVSKIRRHSTDTHFVLSVSQQDHLLQCFWLGMHEKSFFIRIYEKT